MKIATTVASIGPDAGGLYYSVRALCRGIDGMGQNQVSVFSMGEFDRGVFEHWLPLRPITFKRRFPRAYGPAFGMRKAIAEFSPDLIHSHGIWMFNSFVASREARRTGAPLMVSPRGMLDPWAVRNSGFKKKLVGKLFEYRFLQSVDCFHALNHSEAESIRAFGLKQPICIIPNGTDLPVLENKHREPSKVKTLTFIGRIHPKKGLSNLIKSWAQLCTNNPEILNQWRLCIAGWEDGNYLSSYRAEATDAGCGDSIEWRGPVYGEDKDALLRSSDAFVLPSFSEGLPMSVIEAWSFELPVLMTRECNLPEGFDCGAAIELDTSVDGIAAGLERLFSMDEDALRGMGKLGRRLVESSFTWEEQVRKLDSTYRWLLGEAEQPTFILL